MTVSHLVRRFIGSLSTRPPSAEDLRWVAASLGEREMDLWCRFHPADRRHAVTVARRFVDRRPGATRAEVAAALLHDIGKVDADLGTAARVMATLVGPRTDRFRRHHEHERLGAEMLTRIGSDPVTVALVAGSAGAPGDALAALLDADDV